MINFKTAAIAALSTTVLAGAIVASAQTAMMTSACATWDINMKLGTTNSEVMRLQKTLNSMGYTVSTTGVGSMGMETNYFGAKTRAAVMAFQSANPTIVTAGPTGNVFSQTRAALNAKCSTATTPTTSTTPVVSGPVSVALAAVQPNNVLVAGQARAKLADFVFSGNGTVTNLKLNRTGVSNNGTLLNVYLYDTMTGQRLSDSASVLTDGTINFNNAYGLFTVAGSRSVSVLADIQSDNAQGSGSSQTVSGQSIGVAVTGVTTLGNPTAVVSGVYGPNLPIGSAQLATAYFNTTTSPANTTVNAGTTGTTIWNNTLNIGTRAVSFTGATFKYIGSAPTDALANVKLYIDGVQYGNAVSVSQNGYITFVGTPVNLTTGSHTVDVRADIVKGSNRNFYVSIENAGDIMLADSNFNGVNVSLRDGSISGAVVTNKAAGTISINAGSLVATQNAAFTTTSVVGGSSNQTIGSYRFYAYGEDVKVNTLSLTVNQTAALFPASTALNNVTIYVNGAAVTSGQQVTLGTATTFNLGSNLIVPAGTSSIVEVRADIVNSGNTTVTSGTLQTVLNLVTNGAQGQYSYNLTNVPTVTGQSVTVNNGNVVFGNTAGISLLNVSKNQAGVKIGSFSLQAGSSEGINVTNIKVDLSGTATVGTDYTNLRVTDGSQTIVPTATNNFSVNYNLAAGTTKTIEVWVDTLEASATETIIPTMTVSYRGLVSSTNNSTAATAALGAVVSTVTVNTPTLVGASSLGSRYVAGGNTLTNVATYNVTATNGSATINDLTFTASAATPYVIQSLTINGVTASNVGGTVNFYGINLAVPAGTTGVNVPVSVTYAPVTVTGQGGIASGSTDNITLSSMKYTAGGTVTTTAYSVAANPMTVVASLATVKKTSTGSYLGTGSTSGAKLGTVTVTADAKGDISISNMPVSLSLPTGGTASNFIVKANGTNLAGTTGYVAPTSATSGFNFGTTGYRISAGQSVTFDVYADVAGVTTAGNGDISLGTASGFSWTDIVNATAISTTGPLTGTLLTTYNN